MNPYKTQQRTEERDGLQNGVVDQNDLDVMLQNYGRQSGADWSTGDMTGDGKVDFEDFLIQADEYAGQ